MTGFDAAGGCINPVMAIKNIPTPTPRLIAYGFEPKDKPVKAVRRCPNTTFLGCENHTPKTRTILAPKEAISQGIFI